MTKSKYYLVTNGEWIQVPMRGYKEQCCDCCLTHRMNFRITDKGKIEIQTFRDEKATAAARRVFRFTKEE